MSMGSEQPLRPAYELCYAVARRGVESQPPHDPPEAMRSFLYVVNLPPQGFAVAHEAVEKDDAFRLRVAEEANELTLGRASYLWLTRPAGWASELEALMSQAELSSYPEDLEPQPLMIKPLDEELSRLDHHQEVEGLSVASNGHADSYPEANSGDGAIEKELSSLKGLVHRLSTERKIGDSQDHPRINPDGLSPASMFDADLYSLQHDLEAARIELETARQEREAAVRQQSGALARQLELEKELARMREHRASIEREHAEIDASLLDAQEALARAETLRGNLQLERDQLLDQIEGLTQENSGLTQQVGRVIEEKVAQSKALQADYESLEAEYVRVEAERNDLSEQIPLLRAELEDVKAALERSEVQAVEARTLGEALTEEKIDLASRLADTEAMLETVRTQLTVVKGEYENLSDKLGVLTTQRDGLSKEVDELHQGMTEALNDLAATRALNDQDRENLKAVREERNEFRIRLGTLEEEKQGLASQLAAAIGERSTMTERVNQLKADLDQKGHDYTEQVKENERIVTDLARLKEERAKLADDLDSLTADFDSTRAQMNQIQGERDELSRQVEQLTEENQGIQGQLVESDRLRAEATESSGNALSELAQQLSRVENERNRLERELRAAENRLIDAFSTFEAANKEAAERVRDQVDVGSMATSKADPLVGFDREASKTRLTPSVGHVPEPERQVTATESNGDKPRTRDSDTDRTEVVPPKKATTTETPVWKFSPRQPEPEPEPPAVRSSETNIVRAINQLELEGSDNGLYGSPNPIDSSFSPFDQLGGSGFVDESGFSDEDIEGLSNELTQAISNPIGLDSSSPFGDDDDLDAIGELISRTVTDFDPSKLPDYGGADHIDPVWPANGAGQAPNGNPPPSVFDLADGTDFTSGPGGPSGPVPTVGIHNGSGRRQIELPPGIDDEVEVARLVVSSPDVVLLIDGDAVAKMGWPSLPVAQQRDALVSYLSDLAADTGASPDVVFDGRIGEENSLPAGRNVRIRLSTPPTEPTAALDELVDAYPEQWPIAVVTDDMNLGSSAVERGATLLNNGQLLDLFVSQ